ncbi:hypothetical protein PG984_002428 [Apiospora sp. TS-2023a]
MGRKKAADASGAGTGGEAGGTINFSNATVSQGQLVATRAGMQVNKHLYRGTAFVNWSAQETSSPSSPSPASNQEDGSRALPIRPVRWHVKPRIQASRAKQKETPRPETKAQKRAVTLGEASSSSGQNEATSAWAAASGGVYWPIIAYPLGEHALLSYNPLKIPGRYMFLLQDPTSLHCLVAMGALYETLRAGRKDSFLLGSLVSKLYGIIGDHIRGNGDLNTTMNAMATLALIAGYQGNYEHWSLHMKALMQLVPAAGGLDQVDIGVMGGIRKADFAGALSFSTKPFLPWKRRHAKVQCVPEIGLDAMRHGMERHLAPCGLGKATVKAVTTVASYHRCIAYTKRRNLQRRREVDAPVVYEPLEVGEHYDYIMYRLLAEPEPLSTTFTISEAPELQQPNTELLEVSTYSPTPHEDDNLALQSAIRILAILLLREPANDMPCGEDKMLRRLEHHLRTLLHGIVRHKSASQETKNAGIENNDTLSARKPIYLWLCTSGDLISTLQGGATGGRTDKAGHFSIYQLLLRAVLSVDEVADPAHVGEQDLEVCRIMSLGDMRFIQVFFLYS